jgi:hypothetical protein
MSLRRDATRGSYAIVGSRRAALKVFADELGRQDGPTMTAFGAAERNGRLRGGQFSVTGFAHLWNKAEFNVFGDGASSTATFNPGATIGVQMFLGGTSTATPTCDTTSGGNTSETNSLNLVPGSCCTYPPVASLPPSLYFLESNTNATAGFCLQNDMPAINSPLL